METIKKQQSEIQVYSIRQVLYSRRIHVDNSVSAQLYVSEVLLHTVQGHIVCVLPVSDDCNDQVEKDKVAHDDDNWKDNLPFGICAAAQFGK
jgi:hypothetical protein